MLLVLLTVAHCGTENQVQSVPVLKYLEEWNFANAYDNPNITTTCESIEFREKFTEQEERVYILCDHDDAELCEKSLRTLVSSNRLRVINGPDDSQNFHQLPMCVDNLMCLVIGPVLENPMEKERIALIVLICCVAFLFICVIVFAVYFIKTRIDIEKCTEDIRNNLKTNDTDKIEGIEEDHPYATQMNLWERSESSEGIQVEDSDGL